MARSFVAVVATIILMAHMSYAGTLLAPVPKFSLPNATALMDGAKASLRSSVQAMVLNHLKFKPVLCKNGKPLVTCLWNVCEGKCTGENQLCVPDYCGSCGATCVNLTLPAVKVPTLPSYTINLNKSLPTKTIHLWNASKVPSFTINLPTKKKIMPTISIKLVGKTISGTKTLPGFDVKVPAAVANKTAAAASAASAATGLFKLPSLKLPGLGNLTKALPSFDDFCLKNEVLNITMMTANPKLFAANPRIACRQCPVGTIAQGLMCTKCLPGFYADRALGKCIICGAGTYNNKIGSSTCAPCPVNQFAPLPGAFACIKCPKGFESNGTASIKCNFVGFGMV